MTIFLPRTKTDRSHAGTMHKAPALSRLCPVAAYEAWLSALSLTEGPVFGVLTAGGESPVRDYRPAALCHCCGRCLPMQGCLRPTATAVTPCGAVLRPRLDGAQP